MPAVTQRAAARRNLVEHFVCLAEEAGLEVADRFLSNAEASFNALAQQPTMGAPLTLCTPQTSESGGSRASTITSCSTNRVPTASRSCASCTARAIGGSCWGTWIEPRPSASEHA
jgi:plasmid stabilization system protein ParE